MDLDEVWLHIAADNEFYANRFVDEIWRKFALIATQPKMGIARKEIAGDARSFSFRDYLILYRVENHGITVVRVVHGARGLDELL